MTKISAIDRPILFSGPMIPPILQGLKTQTRRVMNPQPDESFTVDYLKNERRSYGWSWKRKEVYIDLAKAAAFSPYGKPGDRLWVRESWCPVSDPFVGACEAVGYAADKDFRVVPEGSFKEGWTVFNWEKPEIWKFRPSIHMPRWASRFTLEIMIVRVERLQEISEEDAKAEGVAALTLDFTDKQKDLWCRRSRQIDPKAKVANYRGAFAVIWDEINGDRAPWDSNPWVWVIEFRKLAEESTK